MKLYMLGIKFVCVICNFYCAPAEKFDYKRIGTKCLMKNDIYFETRVRSRMECAFHCKNNALTPCTRFIFKPIEKLCLLHSHFTFNGVTPTSVTVTVDDEFYGVGHVGCRLPGYDYIPHINSCLKHVYKVLKSWYQANTLCQNDGGSLVSITTLDKWLFLSNYLNCVPKFWGGLKGDNWLNGDLFVNVFDITVNWNGLPDSNNPSDPEYDCGFFGFKNAPHIVDVSCNEKEKQFFVCEIPL